MRIGIRWQLLCAVQGLLLAGWAVPALAGSVCVKASGGNCETTIQDGVDAAAAGDTVKIGKGVYFENVSIPPGKDGLKLQGSSGVILDPGPDGDANTLDNSGSGVEVESNGVTLSGFTIRNGESYCIELLSGVSDTVVSKMRFVNCDNEGVYTSGLQNDGTVISGNDFFGMQNSQAVDLDGDNIHFVGNSVLGGDGGGVEIDGDDMVVEKNEILINGNDGDCVNLGGDRAEVVKNVIEGCQSDAIELSGDDALVSRNKIQNADAGVTVSGDNPVVTDNWMRSIFDDEGVNLDCFGVCDAGEVSGNQIVQLPDDAVGIEVDASGSGFTVEKNVVEQASDEAYELDMFEGTISRNQAIDSSAVEGDPCFEIQGDSNLVERNSAARCSDGFYVSGSDNTLEGNTAVGGAEDGFDIESGATGNTLIANRAMDNAGTGFEISDDSPATGTILTGNRASGNHTDLCDDGSGTVLTDNDFETVFANNTPADNDDECEVGD